MKGLIIFTTVFVFILIILLPLSLTLAIKLIPGAIQPPLGNTKKIYDQSNLSQAFISPEDNLAGIGVSIKNPNFANKKNANINIYDNNNNIIRTIILNGQNIADGKFVKILFTPIKDSLNKKYIWSISSADSKYEDALEIFLTNKQPKWSLELRVNDQLADGGLSYVTLHKPTNFAEVLTRVISNWTNKLVSDLAFLISYTLILLSLLGTLIYINLKRA